jgi:hypothetical protein
MNRKNRRRAEKKLRNKTPGSLPVTLESRNDFAMIGLFAVLLFGMALFLAKAEENKCIVNNSQPQQEEQWNYSKSIVAR